jgi:hypothetical protein
MHELLDRMQCVAHMLWRMSRAQVINERDILGTQLIRRNDELALLYEKIKIQQSTLNKGEVQYRSVRVAIDAVLFLVAPFIQQLLCAYWLHAKVSKDSYVEFLA